MAEYAGVDVGVMPFTSAELMDSLEGLACVQGGHAVQVFPGEGVGQLSFPLFIARPSVATQGGRWICRDLVRQRNRGFQCLARLD